MSNVLMKPVHRTKVYQEVASRLRQWIATRLKPGDSLPPERQLAEMLGVGRSSVRDALHELQLCGIVETRQGIGTIVRDPRKDAPGASLAATLTRQRQHLGELLDFRKILEPPLAARAAQRASAREVTAMQRIVARQAQRVGRGEAAIEEDCAFHECLARSAHNEVVMRVLDTIMDLLRPTREIGFQVEGRPAKSLAGHREILEAVAQRDAAAAEQAMRRHLEQVEAIIARRARTGRPKENL
jgi:GntR family transcriptional regulator, transcriptional repressor for pyruvate dehydrogenase complex